MFKSPMSRFGAEEKTKGQPGHTNGRASNSSGEIRKSMTVNAHHDGHYSVDDHQGGDPVHHQTSDEAMQHVFTAMEPDADDMMNADTESEMKVSGKHGSIVKK